MAWYGVVCACAFHLSFPLSTRKPPLGQDSHNHSNQPGVGGDDDTAHHFFPLSLSRLMGLGTEPPSAYTHLNTHTHTNASP